MWIVWKMWTRAPAPWKSARISRKLLPEAYPHKKKKYPQAEIPKAGEAPVDYVDKLLSEEFFADDMHVPGSHSYQQISGCAIFQ